MKPSPRTEINGNDCRRDVRVDNRAGQRFSKRDRRRAGSSMNTQQSVTEKWNLCIKAAHRRAYHIYSRRADGCARALMDAPVTRGTLNAGSATPIGNGGRFTGETHRYAAACALHWLIEWHWIESRVDTPLLLRGCAGGLRLPNACRLQYCIVLRATESDASLTLAHLARPLFLFWRVCVCKRGPRTQLHLSNSAYVRGRYSERGGRGEDSVRGELAVTAAGRCCAPDS